MTYKNNKTRMKELQFQRNLIPSPRCEGCEQKCIVLYDSHHDEYFGMCCGTVIMEQNRYIIPYSDTYYTSLIKQKKRTEVERIDNNNSSQRQKKQRGNIRSG